MSIVLAVLSIILQTAGVVFLFAATLGLLRFKDALQRMHASTKAGTIGAGLVLAGTVLTMDSAEGIAIGVLAILFLLLTVPVAGHLLGRAAYISGVDLVGLEGRDALHGVLHRSHKPLDCDLSFKGERADTRVTSASVTPAPPLGGVRLAITAPHEETLARRALSIARGNGVPVEAKAIIDTKMIETFASADRGLDTIKAQLADAVAAVQALCAKEDTKLSLFYTEGEVNKLIPDGLRNDLLLVLPLTGRSLHGIEIGTPMAAGNPEGLLNLVSLHAGPVLFTGQAAPPATGARVLVVDDRSGRTITALLWALKAGLWVSPVLTITGSPGQARIEEIQRALALAGVDAKVEHLDGSARPAARVPYVMADCNAAIMTTLPQSQSPEKDGSAWCEHIARDWTGEILMMPHL